MLYTFKYAPSKAFDALADLGDYIWYVHWKNVVESKFFENWRQNGWQ